MRFTACGIRGRSGTISVETSGNFPFLVLFYFLFFYFEAEFAEHILDQERSIQAARASFRTNSEAFAQAVAKDDYQPVRKTDEAQDSVYQYYIALSLRYPCLFFIYNILSKCSASEAETERYFSLEGLVHSHLRNRLQHDAVCYLIVDFYFPFV